MNIPLCKPSIENKEITLISKLLKSKWLTHGPYNKKFEELFAKKIGVKYAISMNSCTSALECSIKSLGKKGEIIIPSFTWVSTANAVINCGSTPVFADIDLDTRNINIESIKKNINKRTVAIIVVHFAGLPCNMSEIKKICSKNKIKIIEDSAETLGASVNNKFTGSFGTGCFSFFPTKNITTTEGGMLTTNNKSTYNYVQKLIAHGIDKSKKKSFWNREAVLPGHNFRMPNHLASLGLSQLKKLKKFNLKRNKIANIYNRELKKLSKYISLPLVPKGFSHSYQMYTIRVSARIKKSLLLYLKQKRIEASSHFDPPLHLQKYLNKYMRQPLPNTEKLAREIVTLPIYPDMKPKEVNYVIVNIKKYFKQI